MMNQKTIPRGLLGAALVAGALLVTGCGGGGSGATEGANSNFSSNDSSFDHKSVKSVSFADVIAQMESEITEPISGAQTFVSIYTVNADSRNQLALLTADLYQNLTKDSTLSTGMDGHSNPSWYSNSVLRDIWRRRNGKSRYSRHR